jgi:hypothetical protein
MQLLANGKQQFIDQNGAPLANGSVYFYAPGTTNPLTTYQDSAGTIPNTNPIQLDSRGQAIIWGSATYRQIVKDSGGVTIWDQIVQSTDAAFLAFQSSLSDTVNAANGDALVGVKQILSGAVARTQHDKNAEFISVRDFGAKGDGTTDDTAAVQKANDALSATGGTIYFPPSTGRYVINGVIVNSANVTWLGTGSPNGGLLVQQAIYVKQSGFSARMLDCQQSGALNGSASNCFSVYSTTLTLSDFVFERCTFNGFFYSVYFFGMLDGLPNGDARHVQNPIYRTKILFCKSTAQAGVNSGHFQHASVYGCLVLGNETYNGQNASSYNFWRDCRDIKAIGNYDANSAWGALEIENSPLANAVVMGNTFESTVSSQNAAIWVDDSANVQVVGNVVQWHLKASCGNGTSDPNGLYPNEICSQTKAYFSNNTCAHVSIGQFSTYVSGTIICDLKDNIIFGSGNPQAILADQYYYGGVISGNKATGTITNFAQLTGLTSSAKIAVYDNQTGGVSCVATGSGNITAYNNDFLWQGVQTEMNVPTMHVSQGVVRMPPVLQSSIAAGASANFVFTTYQAVPQFGGTSFNLRCVCRSGDTPASDYVTFTVLVSNESGTPVCSVSTLNKQLTNNASNFTIAASMSGAVLTLTLTNNNASKLQTIRMFCDNLMIL